MVIERVARIKTNRVQLKHFPRNSKSISQNARGHAASSKNISRARILHDLFGRQSTSRLIRETLAVYYPIDDLFGRESLFDIKVRGA